jgi:hypothetical protein
MAELLHAVVQWRLLVLMLVVFGFAPGAVLRVIVLAYPTGSPRRAELMAELYAMPPFARPRWVFEQLELALFAGLPERLNQRRWRKLDREMEGFVDRMATGAELVEQLGRAMDTADAGRAFSALDDCVRSGYHQIRRINRKARRLDVQPETADRLRCLHELIVQWRDQLVVDRPRYLTRTSPH